MILKSGQFFTNKQLSNDDYHRREGISSSQIKEAQKSLAHFKALVSSPRDITQKQRERFDLGTCAHSIILERSTDEFIKGPEVSSKSVKAWKDFVEHNPDKIVLSPDEYARVIALFGAFMGTPLANDMVSRCKIEHSFFSRDHETGLLFKARPDGYCQDDVNGDYLVDYKTTTSASPENFAKSIYNYGYHISASHYKDVVESCTGRRIKDVFFIVQEITAPYLVAIYRLSPHTLRHGDSIRRALIQKISEAYKTNNFPGYSSKITDIEIPEWAIQKDLKDGDVA